MSDLPNDINDCRPNSIRHIVGQTSVVEQITVALDASQQDGRKFDHALLVGPPGLGKTAMAQVIAAEMATEYIDILGQSIANLADMNAVLLLATDRAIVFIDEAHELDKSMQTSLYLALDQRKIFLAGRRGSTLVEVPVSDFTLLLATTDEYRLLQPLRDRMRLVLRFDFYSDEELAVIVRHRVRSLGWQIEEEMLSHIAGRSRGTPRLALRLLQSAHRVCRSEGETQITQKHLERACLLEQIDDLGLGPTEQQYLRIIGKGATRLNVIASRLGLPSRTVAEVSEPFLIRAGLVMKDEQGRRVLTPYGIEHQRRTSV